jgi:DNA adenine methylase
MKKNGMKEPGDPDLNINVKPRPILKWAGGKQQLLNQLLPLVPNHYQKYIEPFFGGGALYFSLQPQQAVIADSNPELTNVYRMVAENVEGLMECLSTFKVDKKNFYSVRAKDTSRMSELERAARFIYLNKTCFNGLYRVNRQGQFNVPYGDHRNPRICQREELRAASQLLKKTRIVTGDYKQVLKEYAQEGDFVFLDPPYLPVSKYADFKRYTKEQFYEEDHEELAKEIMRLHEMGCYVLLTNSNHPLVYDLYEGFKIDVYKTRRNISKNGKNRRGEDVVIAIPPRQNVLARMQPREMNRQVAKFPPTRYMGSKQSILPDLDQVISGLTYDSVLDLFSGSGVVSYLFKTKGKQVFSNDFMAMGATFTKSMIENNDVTLSEKDIEQLLNMDTETDHFVATHFKDLYFSDTENQLIDCIRFNIKKQKNKYKRALAMSALIRAAVKKRPRGIFTSTGNRYDDGRKDLKTSFSDHFRQAVKVINGAVFDNGKENKSRCGDAMTVPWKPDLVYMDPPYYSPYSDNDYVRRYHFLEGLARDWKGVTIQEHTKTKKFKSYPSPFSSRIGAQDAFDKLFHLYKDSILMISYSSNSLPVKEEMLSLISKYKDHVEVISLDYRYSFANQAHKVKDNKNKVQEYIFIGY